MKRKSTAQSLTTFVASLLMLGSVAHTRGATSEDQLGTAVKIENFVYNPNPLTVSIGTTVRWTNYDVVPHNVVSEDKSFKSKLLEKGEQFSYTFTKPGTFKYVCSIHPKMVARVVVQ